MGKQVSSEELLAAMRRLERDELAVKTTLARVEQARIAAALGRGRRSVNGLGRVRMEVSADVYHYWGQRLGYACWRDGEFLRAMERDNPELRVQCGGTKTMTGWAPTGKRQLVRKYEWGPGAETGMRR